MQEYNTKERVPCKSRSHVRAVLYLTLLLVSIPALSFANAPVERDVAATNGVVCFPARAFAYASDTFYTVKGKWEFFWNRVIPPSAFTNTPSPLPDCYIDAAEAWGDDATCEGSNIPPKGFATYRLHLAFDTTPGQLGIHIIDMSTAYTLFVNGTRVCERGTFGTNKEETRGQYSVEYGTYTPHTNVLDFVFHVANFHDKYGGLWSGIRIAPARAMDAARGLALFFDLFIAGAFFLIACYNMILFFFRRNEKTYLYFGFFCLFLAIRVLTVGERVFQQLFSPFSFEWELKITCLAVFAAFLFFYLFMKSLMQKTMPNAPTRGIIGGPILHIIATPFLPPELFTMVFPVFYLFLFPGLFLVLFGIGREVVRKNVLGYLMLLGFLILFAGVVVDSLTQMRILSGAYVFQFAIVVFLVIQSVVIARRYADVFNEAEALSNCLSISNAKLTELNEHLEEKVAQRTRESERARTQAELANMQKSKFLANMSHELRTPLNSINGIADLLRFGSYEKGEEIAEELRALIATKDTCCILPGEERAYVETLAAFLEEDGNMRRFFVQEIETRLAPIADEERTRRIDRITSLIDEEEHDTFKAYRGIKEAGDYLLGLIDTVLNLSKVETGKMDVTLQPTDLALLIDSVMVNAESYARAKGKERRITFRATLTDGVPNPFSLDARKTRQVLLNFLSNAIKFTDKGCVTLNVARENNKVVFSVEDEGMGIPEKEREIIFIEFERTSATQSIEGTGLGLALSKKLVEIQDGTIGFTSEEGKGSRFWFALPITKNDATNK